MPFAAHRDGAGFPPADVVLIAADEVGERNLLQSEFGAEVAEFWSGHFDDAKYPNQATRNKPVSIILMYQKWRDSLFTSHLAMVSVATAAMNP